MPNEMRNEFIARLVGVISDEDLTAVENAFDIVAAGYEIRKTSTELVVYNGDIPNELKWFIADMHVRNMSPLTIKNYTYAYMCFFRTMNKPLNEIKTNDIQAYLYWYQTQRLDSSTGKQKKISGRSLDKLRQVLLTFFTWCVDNEYLTANPMKNIRKGKFEIKKRVSMNRMELEELLDACKTLREKAIINFLYSTGCRVSELADCKKENINWTTKPVEVNVVGKGRKERIVYLNDRAVLAVKKYFDSRTDSDSHVIATESPKRGVGHLRKDGLEEVVRIILKRTKIKKNVTPHVIRHTTATFAAKGKMPVNEIQKILGHSNVGTTMIYIDTLQENVAADYERTIV